MDKPKEQEYKERIRANLDNVLESGFIPELGNHKKGKVRDVHSSDGKVVMVASDRISAFDHILSRCVPFKGAVLNLINRWAMEITSDIIPNAMIASPDVSVIVQRDLKNSGFECVVREYIWGSLASDYEKGDRVKSGVILPEGRLRYQKLDKPMFTPTTKAEKGHDVDVTLDDITEKLGREMAERIKNKSIILFKRGAEHAEAKGMIFVDTKYEFGIDNEGDLYVIDELNTPDSSRFCSKIEYDKKWPKIARAMSGKRYKDVTELLKARPHLKIREESKQFVRDVLIESGYKDGQPIPDLTDEQIIETAWRYINSYERLTGKEFDFGSSELSPKKRIMNNLVKAGLAYGGCVIPIGASERDKEHWVNIERALKSNNVPYTQPVYLSAHKKTQEVLDYLREMNTSIEPIVYLTFAGRSNGLGPVVAGNTNYPVITCPVFNDIQTYAIDIHSSLRMPSNLPLATIPDPGNAVLFAKGILDLAR